MPRKQPGRKLLSACLHGLFFEAKEGRSMLPQASTRIHGVTYQNILTHQSHCCENLNSHEGYCHFVSNELVIKIGCYLCMATSKQVVNAIPTNNLHSPQLYIYPGSLTGVLKDKMISYLLNYI
jgi:hypothetical protein